MAGSSLLTVLTAATGYAYQVYFIKGLVDTALTLVNRVGDEIDSVVSASLAKRCSAFALASEPVQSPSGSCASSRRCTSRPTWRPVSGLK